MVKKCEVLINNEAVTVINFDGREVQIPSIKNDIDYVNILYKDGKYIVVGDDYKEKQKVEKIENKPIFKPENKDKKTTYGKKPYKKHK